MDCDRWMTGPAELIGGVRAICGYTTFSAPTPLQQGIEAALRDEPPEFYKTVTSIFEANFARLAAALTGLGLEVCAAEGEVGGYFLVANVKATGMTGMEYCTWLANEVKVAAVPLSVFYEARPDGDAWSGNYLVRFAICKQQATIEEACVKLEAAAPVATAARGS